MKLTNALLAERNLRSWTQERVARLVGVSRQSYSAIEAGTSVPSTDVALRIARAFGRSVEELFHLPDPPAVTVTGRWAGEGPALGRRVRLVRVGGHLLAAGLGEGERPALPADGVVTHEADGSVEVSLLADRPPEASLSVVGCDPAMGVVAGILGRERGVHIAWRQMGSRAALLALGRGDAHIAGAHLRDPTGDEYNRHWVSELVPFACTRVSFAWWEEGLLVPSGNPLGIVGVEDLARPGVRFLNRETGSGSRALLDQRLDEARIPRAAVQGYDGPGVRGHMALAEVISCGLADVGVGIRAAGEAYGLETVALETERYDLIVPDHFLDLPAVQALLEVIRRPGVKAQVEALGGYDASVMGEPR